MIITRGKAYVVRKTITEIYPTIGETEVVAAIRSAVITGRGEIDLPGYRITVDAIEDGLTYVYSAYVEALL